MKNRLKYIICTILFVCCILCNVGCSCVPSMGGTAYSTVPQTDITMFEKGKSDYKVVIPVEATEWEKYAAEELVLFFRQATGYALEVVSDRGINFSENEKHISIGNTAIYAQSGVSATYDELGRDGYKIVRKGKTVVLAGGGGYGNVYAVYGFLEHLVDFKPFAPDEIYVRKATKLNMLDFNLTETPDFATRGGGYYVTMTDRVFATRSRTLAGYDTRLFGVGGIWGSWAHNHLSFLPLKEYQADHPDWYGADFTQLCLSNMEMRDEFTVQVQEQILATPDSEFYMLGQMDIATFCECDNCNAITEKIGNSGLMMQFINDIAERIENWQQTACPDREFKICTFAYQETEEPPVVKNADGSYSPIDPSVVARDNVYVEIAPINADWLAPIDSEENNQLAKRMIEGWQVCAKNIMMWGYCNNFSQTLEYFDNINTIATNYKVFRDAGVKFLYDESSGSTKQGFAFQTMMAYIHSELMWDCEQNVNELVDDFMRHYYKEAYEPFKEYFNLMTNYVTLRKQEFSERDKTYYGTSIFNDRASERKTLLNKEFWSRQILTQMLDCFERAYKAIEEAGYEGDEKETMLLRLKAESLTPRMYLLHLFSTEINTNEYLQMIDEFESDAVDVGVSSVFSANGSLANDMEKWRANVK